MARKIKGYSYNLCFRRNSPKVNVIILYGRIGGGKVLETKTILIITVNENDADIPNKKVINRPDADEVNAHIAEMFDLLKEPVINGDTETVNRIVTERLKYRKFFYRDRKSPDTEYIRPLADNITPEGHAIAQRIREKIASCCK